MNDAVDPDRCDLLIRGGLVSDTDRSGVADVAVRDGVIVAVGPSLDLAAGRVVDARGRHVLPGFIDAHVHFNEPGRTDWEGFATGTAALAAGGGTAFCDMPLNSSPPVLDAASFDAKAAALLAHSRLDGALWGGLTPLNLDRMEELAARGVIGFKAFMSDSGMDDFPRADAGTLREGMARAAAVGRPVAVHAESEEITSRLAREIRARGGSGIGDYLASRPVQAELEAIGVALALARETGCALHVVHVSTAAGLGLIAEARARGQDVSAETCPHYLLLEAGDVFRLGAVAKCAPPLRPLAEREALWQALWEGRVDTVGSDHSPAPPGLKTDENFFKVWGGISGCQHALPLFFEAAVLERGWGPSVVARLTAGNVARRFGLAGKGRIAPGADADLVLLSVGETGQPIPIRTLRYRHPQSPYVDRPTRVAVVETYARGLPLLHASPGGSPRPVCLLKPWSPADRSGLRAGWRTRPGSTA